MASAVRKRVRNVSTIAEFNARLDAYVQSIFEASNT